MRPHHVIFATIATVVLPLSMAQSQVAGSTQVPAPPPGQPRALALPDTLGANFDIADSASARGAPTDYEAFIGNWQFRFQQRRTDGLWNPVFSGTWSFSKKNISNALIVDHWRSLNALGEEGTYTYRAFNPARGLWEIQGVDTNRGRFDGGLTWSDATSRYVVQHTGTAVMRIRYFAISADHFLWRADRSTDGGKTWLLDTWTMDVTRTAR